MMVMDAVIVILGATEEEEMGAIVDGVGVRAMAVAVREGKSATFAQRRGTLACVRSLGLC